MLKIFLNFIFSFIYIVIYLFFILQISYSNIENEYYQYKNQEYQRGVYGNKDKYADLVYEYEGVTNNFRLYIDNTSEQQELILWNIDENWENNRIKVNKKVQEFWAYVNNYGIFIIYRRSNNIHWKIYRTNNGQELVGGFLSSENNLYLKLKDTYFTTYKQGVFVSLVFYDNLGKQSYCIYYIDIWGRHDLVIQKTKK